MGCLFHWIVGGSDRRVGVLLNRMPWSDPLKTPLTLKDGRKLLTLKDAANVLLGLPESQQHWPTWLHAATLLKGAAEGEKAAIDQIDIQLYIALKQSRMLAR
jgi:hypothetical protein